MTWWYYQPVKNLLARWLQPLSLFIWAESDWTVCMAYSVLNSCRMAFALALSYLTIIVVINSFNLIDGIDGLAASLGYTDHADLRYLFLYGRLTRHMRCWLILWQEALLHS